MHYKCECGKAIGLMLDKNGNPEKFRCPYTRRMQPMQTPQRREPLPHPKWLEPEDNSRRARKRSA